jgi:hypothetical protein
VNGKELKELRLISFQFIAQDCLFLGKQSFDNGYYGHAVEWLEGALMRAHQEGYATASVAEILPFYAMVKQTVSDLQCGSLSSLHIQSCIFTI